MQTQSCYDSGNNSNKELDVSVTDRFLNILLEAKSLSTGQQQQASTTFEVRECLVNVFTSAWLAPASLRRVIMACLMGMFPPALHSFFRTNSA
ncbi:MAG: hypothetical protein EZS28_008284 [Streblomastix strix]|uniref:Uncharacterized protein n=1 Tax=Streblomastix strix TaxID=222440 RepID=A0A5J4WM78_9EUKA|nr:MAG: hypothetical protein EZS28_008284 [Streblomastix strix]